MDLKKLLLRAGSGVVYCGILAGATLAGAEGVLVLSVVLAVTGCLELEHITGNLSKSNLPVVILDIIGCVCLSTAFMGYPLLIWMAVVLGRFILQLYVRNANPLKDTALSLLTQLYIGLPMASMTALAAIVSPRIVLLIFILLWINDTGAYLTGCTFGKHRLFERISPKKSWEGFIGGFLISVTSAVIFALFCPGFFQLERISSHWSTWLGFGAVACIFGTWGDLVESMFKRSLAIKDSGNVIPGHGGILDRIDSLLFALPASLIYVFMAEAL